LLGINLTQPHLNDMDKVYATVVDRGIKMVGFSPDAAATAGRDLRGRVHCPSAAAG